MKPTILHGLFLLFAATIVPTLQAADTDAGVGMTGRWQGSCHVIVVWCAHTELPVSLDIHSDGSVTGKVGDAELTNARLEKKWMVFGRSDGRRSTHLITGRLQGAIVGSEGISRSKVFIHLGREDTLLTGGLATSGSKVGGKDSMVLTATSLRLTRS